MSREVRKIQIGDYVLATKWGDGSSRDEWCVGFFNGELGGEMWSVPRYDVVNEAGVPFQLNGFRRVEKITSDEGSHFIKSMYQLEYSTVSLWAFLKHYRRNKKAKS